MVFGGEVFLTAYEGLMSFGLHFNWKDGDPLCSIFSFWFGAFCARTGFQKLPQFPLQSRRNTCLHEQMHDCEQTSKADRVPIQFKRLQLCGPFLRIVLEQRALAPLKRCKENGCKEGYAIHGYRQRQSPGFIFDRYATNHHQYLPCHGEVLLETEVIWWL